MLWLPWREAEPVKQSLGTLSPVFCRRVVSCFTPHQVQRQRMRVKAKEASGPVLEGSCQVVLAVPKPWSRKGNAALLECGLGRARGKCQATFEFNCPYMRPKEWQALTIQWSQSSFIREEWVRGWKELTDVFMQSCFLLNRAEVHYGNTRIREKVFLLNTYYVLSSIITDLHALFGLIIMIFLIKYNLIN